MVKGTVNFTENFTVYSDAQLAYYQTENLEGADVRALVAELQERVLNLLDYKWMYDNLKK